MRLLQNSDIYGEFLNKGNNISDKIFKVIGGQSGAIVLNDKLKKDIDVLQRVYKEQIIVSIIKAIKDNNILLVKIPTESKFPTSVHSPSLTLI